MIPASLSASASKSPDLSLTPYPRSMITSAVKRVEAGIVDRGINRSGLDRKVKNRSFDFLLFTVALISASLAILINAGPSEKISRRKSFLSYTGKTSERPSVSDFTISVTSAQNCIFFAGVDFAC